MITKLKKSSTHKKIIHTYDNAADLLPHKKLSLKILHERADRLAKHKDDDAAHKTTISYIRFCIGEHEKYGIPYASAKEVLKNITVTKLPHAPDYIAGVVNYRGSLLTVIDFRKFFHKSTESSEGQCVIVIQDKGITVGILANSIEGSDEYEPNSLVTPLPSETVAKSKYITGLHDGVTAVVHVEAMLSDIKLQLEKL